MQNIVKLIERPMLIHNNLVTVEDVESNISVGQTVKIVMPAQERKIVAPVYTEEVVPVEVPTASVSFSMAINRTYIFKVRQYMTKTSTPDFDFQQKWNNNIPMPFRIMKGTVIKETRGMYMMKCNAVPLRTNVCSRCGRALTHPVSRLYGIGPECGGHAHVNPFETEEELYEHLDEITKALESITWTGWVIKSAIEEFTEVPL